MVLWTKVSMYRVYVISGLTKRIYQDKELGTMAYVLAIYSLCVNIVHFNSLQWFTNQGLGSWLLLNLVITPIRFSWQSSFHCFFLFVAQDKKRRRLEPTAFAGVVICCNRLRRVPFALAWPLRTTTRGNNATRRRGRGRTWVWSGGLLTRRWWNNCNTWRDSRSSYKLDMCSAHRLLLRQFFRCLLLSFSYFDWKRNTRRCVCPFRILKKKGERRCGGMQLLSVNDVDATVK